MAKGQIIFDYGIANTGSTLYAMVLYPSSGLFFKATTQSPEEYATANRADYIISLSEAGNQGIYMGSMPAVTEGELILIICDRAGGSPADSDERVFVDSVIWMDGKVTSGGSFIVRPNP